MEAEEMAMFRPVEVIRDNGTAFLCRILIISQWFAQSIGLADWM